MDTLAHVFVASLDHLNRFASILFFCFSNGSVRRYACAIMVPSLDLSVVSFALFASRMRFLSRKPSRGSCGFEIRILTPVNLIFSPIF